MRQAIETKYLGPTNYRGARVKATCQAGSATVSWDARLDVDQNHDRAVMKLCAELGWKGELISGALASGSGNVYVFIPEHVRTCYEVSNGIITVD